MSDKSEISREDKLVDAGRGVPQDTNDKSLDHVVDQQDADQSESLDERIRKAGA